MAIIRTVEIIWKPPSLITADVDVEEEIGFTSIRNNFKAKTKDFFPFINETKTAFSNNVPTQVNQRAQINVIKMQVHSSNKYQAFFAYEDIYSKYVILKPLENTLINECISEITDKCVDIFSVIGVPQILQSSNGRYIAKRLVHELRRKIPALEIVHGNILRKNNRRDFKNLMKSWQNENPSRLWHEGLHFIQVSQNSSILNSGREKFQGSPAEIFFKRNVANDISRLVINSDRFQSSNGIWTEEEWLKNHANQIRLADSIDNAKSFKCKPVKITEAIHQNSTDNIINKNFETFESKLLENIIEVNTDEPAIRCQHEVIWNDNDIKPSFATSVDNNDKKENVDNYNLISNLENELILETETSFNEMKENVDNFGFIHHVKNEPIFETEKSSDDAKKCENLKKDTFQCNMCDRVFRRYCHYKNHQRSHKKTLKTSITSSTMKSMDKIIEFNHYTEVPTQDINDVKVERRRSDEEYSEEHDVSASKIPKIQPRTLPLKRKNRKLNKLIGDDLLECKFCKKKFHFQSVLERHTRIHTNERPYICKICKKSFKQLGHLSQHAMTHIDYRSYECPVCGFKFESLEVLKNHIESHKDDNNKRSFKELYRLYECDICKKVFTAKSVVERHIYTHTHDRHFTCELCGKQFKQAGHLKSHILVHTGIKNFECTICFKKFGVSQSLKKHMFIHTGNKPFRCDICGMRFLETRNLNGHLLTHTNDRPYVCKICGKKYTLADTLKRHIHAAHEHGSTYQCEICAKLFKQLAHLNVHMRIHYEDRPFQCHVCKMTFKHKCVLTSHLAIHANLRPFECDICQATFARKYNLRTHINSAHMDERPYSCLICYKNFKQISHLNSHVIIHTNYLPYKCHVCNKRFNRHYNLKKHMKLHMRNNGISS